MSVSPSPPFGIRGDEVWRRIRNRSELAARLPRIRTGETKKNHLKKKKMKKKKRRREEEEITHHTFRNIGYDWRKKKKDERRRKTEEADEKLVLDYRGLESARAAVAGLGWFEVHRNRNPGAPVQGAEHLQT